MTDPEHNPGQPVVRITLERIYEKLLEVADTVTRSARDDVYRDQQLARHDADIAELKSKAEKAASKEELDQLRREQQSRSRWAIGTALTALGLVIAAAGVIAAIAQALM